LLAIANGKIEDPRFDILNQIGTNYQLQIMSLQSVINNLLSGVLQPLVMLLVGVAIVLFIYGLLGYLKAGLGDKEAATKAKNMMVWGVVIIFVMVSVWGFVQVMQRIFFGPSAPVGPPDIPLMDGTRGQNYEYDGTYQPEPGELPYETLPIPPHYEPEPAYIPPPEQEHQTIPW